jgi:pimeloyl-ACP methyl ester carboxylesterase
MAHSDQLGTAGEVAVSGGTIRYRERGEGAPVLFLHGVLVNGDLWRGVVPRVAQAGFRCVTPDLPLGSHEQPMDPGAELTPPALAGMIVELIDRLGLDRPVVVANDTSCALTQIVMAEHPDKLGPVVLACGDAFENFFPPLFRYLSLTARLPGGALVLAQTMRIKPAQRLPIAFGWLMRPPADPEVMASYVRPIRENAGVRRDATKFLRNIHRRYTLDAARRLGDFEQPVLLAWGDHGKVFPVEDARRLAEVLPDARVEVVKDSHAFVPEDQPETLARLVVDFANRSARDRSRQTA